MNQGNNYLICNYNFFFILIDGLRVGFVGDFIWSCGWNLKLFDELFGDVFDLF